MPHAILSAELVEVVIAGLRSIQSSLLDSVPDQLRDRPKCFGASRELAVCLSELIGEKTNELGVGIIAALLLAEKTLEALEKNSSKRRCSVTLQLRI